ncbi:Protein kinase C-binding protein 1 [Geodia barretti]|nr:Protein kinase C-binding protein 1 [Geodia barretti]
MNVVFEKQDASKNDSYCWVCHDGGDVLCCDRCPRVFHVQCSGLPKEPEGEEEWFCPVCKNIDRRTKRSRPPNLRDLLLLAVRRMMFPGTEIFQHPVPSDILKHYKEYIFFPMYLNKIKERVEEEHYGTTRQFLHDTEWILHNCIIYNGAKHALTKIAKGIVKVCKEDMREIELCPSCYKLTVVQPEEWFCIPCSTPHRVVLAKVRGYPLWPAKLISETTDKCDVRFFGQHDSCHCRSLVPKSCIQELTGPPPTPSSKTQYWNIAMYELRKYRENIDAMYREMGGTKPATPTKAPEPSSLKPGARAKPMAEPNLQKTEEEEAPSNQGAQILSYLPFSPQLVEVIPSMSEAEVGHGNAATLMSSPPGSTPSSPASEGGLQIDDSSWRRKERSPAKPQPSTEGFMSVGRRTQNSLQSVLDTVELGPVVPALTPGTPLLGGGSGARGVAGPRAKKRGLAGVVSILSKKLALSEDGDPDYEEGNNHPLFSRCYDDQGKTAIAEIDPEPKRPVRKVKKPGEKDTEPSPKKAARAQSLKPVVGTPEPGNSPSPRPVPVPLAPFPSTTPQPSSFSSLRVENPRKEKPKTSTAGKPKRGRPPKQRPLKPPKSQATPITFPAPPVMTTPTSVLTTPTSTVSTLSHDSSEVRRMLSGGSPALAMGREGGEGGEGVEGTGLLAETMRKVDRSFRAKLLAGSAEDLGYQYFVEKLMSSIKTVLIEMLSQFEAKGKLGAKVIREQLHSAWPVPGSRSSHDQLRRELLEQLKQELEVVRAAADMEREQVVSEVRRQAEAEKEIAIAETKKKKWCSYCMKEALYNCCWNANYCNESCQQAHWPEHMKSCVQARQSATPAPEAPPTPQSRQTGFSAATPTDPQTFAFAPPPRTGTSGTGHIVIPHTTPQSSRDVGGASEPMLHYAQSAAHADPRSEQAGLDKAMTRIEHVPNESGLLSGHQASQHMLLLHQAAAVHGQHSLQSHAPTAPQPTLQRSSCNKNSVISGIRSHPSSASLYQPLVAQIVDGTRDTSSHNLPSGMPHPSSPASPVSEHSTVHNPPGFSWPYQQPVIISSTDGYPLPMLQSSVAQPQHQSYFNKAF